MPSRFNRCIRLFFFLYMLLLSSCANESAHKESSKPTATTGTPKTTDTAQPSTLDTAQLPALDTTAGAHTETSIEPPPEHNNGKPARPATAEESGNMGSSNSEGGTGIGRGGNGTHPIRTRRGPTAAIQRPTLARPGIADSMAAPTPPKPPVQASITIGLDSGDAVVNSSTSRNDSMAMSTLAYSYFDSIAENETKYIWAKIKSNSTKAETVESLKEHIQHVMAQPIKASDTNAIKSIFIKGYRFVTITPDPSPDFDIALLEGEAKQELDIVDGNNWRWSVKLKKDVTSPTSSITLRIKATNNVNGLKDYEDQQVIMIDVNITKAESGIANTLTSTTPKSKAGLIIGILIGVIVLGLIFFFRKKLARVTGMEKKPQVFFSYAWGQEREQFVDKLYDSLKEDGYRVVRDKVSLGYKGVISQFMTSIGKGQFIVVAISDKYLTSEFCMFELFEIFRNSKMEKEELVKRIYPVCIENLNLNSPAVIAHYLQFWENKEKEWEQLIKDNTGGVSEEQQADYTRVKRIIAYLGSLLDFLSDVNFLDQQQLSEDNFQQIKSAIQQRIAEDV
jgi:hypothetical protein